ncbi:hypothetical protein DFQ28_006975 [Apophysomyces sp. BC1034]|nr:hypothetical protein DFQ30_006990 [Apophysomyces sp. BC1015]KAG0187020.1 hypothetical protein DFQ28_006975 [Apophysomyces sp. BC1034]
MPTQSKDKSTTEPKPSKPDDEQESSPLPPPHPVTPPPQNPHSQDSSELLSPWWSAEPPPDRPPEKKDSQVILNISRTADVDNVVNGEKTGEKTTLWKEKCFVLTTRKQNTEPKGDALKDQFQSECRMVCFLRECEKLREARKEKLNLTNTWNPFYGTWLVVATTRARCLEHMGGKAIVVIFHNLERSITLNRNIDYKEEKASALTICSDACSLTIVTFTARTITPSSWANDLVDREKMVCFSLKLQHSYVQAIVKELAKKTFAPVQELSSRYVNSWKDGTQMAFFGRFWESVKRGDAFSLVIDSTKRFVDSAVGSEKKSDNNDNNKKK